VVARHSSNRWSTKKAAANTLERQPQPYYFKRPVDCDDEESLEEGRGRTVLRTAMLSTRADRYYGPPDGIQPEFDLLFAAQPDRLRRLTIAPQIVSVSSPRSYSRSAAMLWGDEQYNIILVRERRASRFLRA
jgi:hypothetical protein